MSIKEIIFESSLYSRWKRIYKTEEDEVITNHHLDHLISVYDERVERFCVKCESNRVFAADKNIFPVTNIRSVHYPNKITDQPSLFKSFRCSGNEKHKIIFGFLVDEDEVVKISEYPSKYDSVKDTFNKYKKVLEKSKITELSKAAQLESFGYAIASLLYYRRIFERIIFKTFQDSDFSGKLPENEFRYLKMDEKINHVSEHLPEYFTENSHIYGVLSKGVHELEENECREYLPIVKTIIFYSLDEALDKKNKELRKIEMSKKLNEIKTKMK